MASSLVNANANGNVNGGFDSSLKARAWYVIGCLVYHVALRRSDLPSRNLIADTEVHAG